MLSLKWGRSRQDINAAQALRYQVFFRELGAIADRMTRRTRRDADSFDAICDHLLVIESSAPDQCSDLCVDGGQVVGTYRLLRQDVAQRNGGFYSRSEFDLAPLLAGKPQLDFLELGRSCILPAYRSRAVIELLWRGISEYVSAHRLDALFGCASLPGTDPERWAPQLSLLAHNFMADVPWRASPHADRHVGMKRMPRGYYDERRALAGLPPLIKGYLRAGARVGDGAVIDHQFNTIDVFIILPLSQLSRRHQAHFGVDKAGAAPAHQPLIS